MKKQVMALLVAVSTAGGLHAGVLTGTIFELPGDARNDLDALTVNVQIAAAQAMPVLLPGRLRREPVRSNTRNPLTTRAAWRGPPSSPAGEGPVRPPTLPTVPRRLQSSLSPAPPRPFAVLPLSSVQ